MDMKPKRVLLFALTYYPKFVGGDGVAVKEITDRISKKNPTPESLVRFPMYVAKVLFPLSAFRKALVLQRTYRFDMVWPMMVYAGFPAVLFNFFYKKIPVMLTLQDGDPVEKIAGRARIKVVLPLFKRIFVIPKYVQSISTYLADFARDMGYTGRVSVVPNGVDVKKFSTFDEARVEEIKDTLQKDADTFWLFTASRLVEKNANDIVIRAVAKLPAHVQFVIAGTGPDREQLERLAGELGVAERVHFLGHINHEDLPHYLRAADAFIRPSRTEGFGNSFVEAMAADVPVIATTAGGIKDFLFHDENGLEVGIESVDDVVEQTLRLMSDVTLRETITRNAYDMVAQQYDWNTVAEQMITLFDTVTEQRG